MENVAGLDVFTAFQDRVLEIFAGEVRGRFEGRSEGERDIGEGVLWGRLVESIDDILDPREGLLVGLFGGASVIAPC